jgi:hypothetical protein
LLKEPDGEVSNIGIREGGLVRLEFSASEAKRFIYFYVCIVQSLRMDEAILPFFHMNS